MWLTPFVPHTSLIKTHTNHFILREVSGSQKQTYTTGKILPHFTNRQSTPRRPRWYALVFKLHTNLCIQIYHTHTHSPLHTHTNTSSDLHSAFSYKMYVIEFPHVSALLKLHHWRVTFKLTPDEAAAAHATNGNTTTTTTCRALLLVYKAIERLLNRTPRVRVRYVCVFMRAWGQSALDACYMYGRTPKKHTRTYINVPITKERWENT